MPLHNDEPCIVDALDRGALVHEVGKAVATCSPPQVFGIHGDWGLGKTSFLHQLHFHLVGTCPQQPDDQVEAAAKIPGGGRYRESVRVVWFEAWRYQHDRAPVVALLHEIRSQLAWHLKALSQLKKTVSVAVRGALLSMEDPTKQIGFQASKIEKAGEQWEREHLAARLPSHTIREQLTQAIDGLLSAGFGSRPRDRRLVVIIDDLDRCDPEGAYRLLEGLKIYLTLPNCVFVLGMNQRIVEDAIAKQVPIPDKQEHLRPERAAAYLEKLCQNVWRLPAVADPKRHLLQLLPETIVRNWIDAALGAGPCLPPNPRRIKGMANLLERFADRHLPQDGPPDDADLIQKTRLMFVVAYVYQFHHDLYRLWEINPGLFDHIRDWVRSVGPAQGSPVSPLFDRLRRAVLVQTDEKAPTPVWNVATAFPDPSESNVFWIQSLVHELGHDVTAESFQPYLRGHA